MGAGPPRTPNVIQLPGLGFFHHSPTGLDNLTIGPRIAQRIASPLTAVPASGTVSLNANVTFMQPTNRSGAIWIEDVWCFFQPTGAQNLQLISGQIVMFGNGPGGYDLGLFAVTLSTPGGGLVTQRDQQKLITLNDLNQLGVVNFAPGELLGGAYQVVVKNTDAVNPHNAQLFAGAVFRQLYGLLE